jgi:hypothetical protein
MHSARRVQIARWSNANQIYDVWKYPALLERYFGSSDWETVGSLALWAAGRHLDDFSGKTDEELKMLIRLQYGFADDETIDPSRVIKSPDQLVVGCEYALASNGYVLGKYTGQKQSFYSTRKFCEPEMHQLWSFDNGTEYGDTRDSFIWTTGVYRI